MQLEIECTHISNRVSILTSCACGHYDMPLPQFKWLDQPHRDDSLLISKPATL